MVLAKLSTPAPAATPFAITQQSTIDTTSDATIALPSSAEFGGTLSVPAAQPPGPADVTLTFSGGPISDPAVPPLARRRTTLSVSGTPILFVGFSSARTLVLPRGLSWSIRLPAARIVPGASYDLALYDPGAPQLGWQLGYYPLAQPPPSGILTFPAPPRPFTLVAQRTYYFTLLVLAPGSSVPTPEPSPAATQTAKPTPTPTPVPTPTSAATPSPVPTPVASPTSAPTLTPLVATPTSIAFNAPGQTSTVTVTEPGYGGPFVAESDALAVATVSGGGARFTVTSGPSNGAAHITIRDPRPGGASVRVDVLQTFTTVVVHDRRRSP